MHRRTIAGLVVIALLFIVVGSVAARSGALPGDLQDVRAALSQYHSFDRAQAAGYSAAGEPCVASPDGTMGIHAVNQAILASGRNDAARPPILVYLPGTDGSMRLVAVEWFAAALANTPDGPVPWFEAAPPPTGSTTRRQAFSAVRSTGRCPTQPADALALRPARVAVRVEPSRDIRPVQSGHQLPVMTA